MDVEQMREKIADEYTSWTWKDKVARMPEDQVMAIYFKFQAEGRFDYPKQPMKKEPVQLTIDDILR